MCHSRKILAFGTPNSTGKGVELDVLFFLLFFCGQCRELRNVEECDGRENEWQALLAVADMLTAASTNVCGLISRRYVPANFAAQ
jgi:hypothetical protein